MVRAETRVEPQPSDETALLARLRAGEDAAFAELMRRTGGRLLAVARRMLRSEEDARDALQDALLQAFRGIDAFAGEARLSTWLHRIVVNACLMKLRSQGRRPEQPIEELLPTFLADGHRADPGPAWRAEALDALERSELRRLVRAAIDRLPEIYRSALLLRDIEELGTEEAARLLGVKPEAFKMRVHRARQALRTLLDAQLREPS